MRSRILQFRRRGAGKGLFSPVAYPIYFFLLTILAGTAILKLEPCLAGREFSWLDALFTATSATCVTGLAVVDTGTHFTPLGQGVILALIQLGGLGIMTYASLIFYIWRQKVSLVDRIAVGQSLLHDPDFKLGRFLVRLVLWTFAVEFIGGLCIFLLDPQGFPLPSALFHSVSAFCNAGFSLHSSSLMDWKDHLGVNIVMMVLISLGGIGFSLSMEVMTWCRKLVCRERNFRFSWYGRVVLCTSLLLVGFGALGIWFAEGAAHGRELLDSTELLGAFFQSVTCRTAGFNSLEIGAMTNVSLFIMIMLMFVGGSPGSTAGGIKTTTAAALGAYILAQIRGQEQTVVLGRAIDADTQRKSLNLMVFSSFIVVVATLCLCITEGGAVAHTQARGQFLELLFESVSAFATVGLTTGITPELSAAGKCIIIVLMFVGRIGLLLFLTVLQGLHEKPAYRWPEESMLVG